MTRSWPWERALPWIVFAAGAAALACVSAHRTFLSFGTETDFLASFLPEAERILRGEPLVVDVHPPGYSVALALATWALGDGVRGGLALSWLSAVAVLVSSYFFFGRLFGRAAAWGSLGCSLCSRLFVAFGARASSDMFFLALISVGLLLVESAIRTGRGLRWFLGGVLVGAIVLTRSNGATFLVLLASPLAAAGEWRAKRRSLGIVVTGTLVPLVAWATFAQATGSPLLPTKADAALAMSFLPHAGNPYSGETMDLVDKESDGLADVLLRDPLLVVGTYLSNLARLAWNVLRRSTLVSIPWNVLALPGLLLLIPRLRVRAAAICLGVLALQVMAMGVKAFEPRFFLVAVPLLGVAAGVALEWLWKALTGTWKRLVVGCALAGLVAVGGWTGFASARRSLHANDREIGEAAAVVRLVTEPSDAIVARKPHIPYFAGRSRTKFPVVTSLEELERALRWLQAGRSVFVYFGSAERHFRPALLALSRPEAAPPWLTPVATSKVPGRWVLYRLAEEVVARDGSP